MTYHNFLFGVTAQNAVTINDIITLDMGIERVIFQNILNTGANKRNNFFSGVIIFPIFHFILFFIVDFFLNYWKFK